VKTLTESTGDVNTATPSLAVQMTGLNSVPTAGDEFYVCSDENQARKAAEAAEDAQVGLPLCLTPRLTSCVASVRTARTCG